MQLLPESLRASIPPLYATEHMKDPMVWCKFFALWTPWTWYVIECDRHDICFGLVCGDAVERGYFSLRELSSVRGPGGLRIERDIGFEPTRLSRVQALCERR